MSIAQNYMARYNEAIKLIEQGKTAEARTILSEIAKLPGDTGLRDNAAYWTAVTYFDEGKYGSAIEYYRKAQNLPDGNKAAAAQYEMAFAMEKSGDTSGAIIEFYRLQALYPNSGLVERADSAVKNLGGSTIAYIPDYGPETPSLQQEYASKIEKQATPLSPEPRPDAPMDEPEELRPDAPLDEGPVVATEGPLAGAEIPVPPKRKQDDQKQAEPLGESKPAPEPEPLNGSKTQPLGEEGETTQASDELASTEQITTQKTPTDKDSGDTQKDTLEQSEKEVDYGDTAPLDVDPSKLIKPEDKQGWE